jgi:hypothetical protein
MTLSGEDRNPGQTTSTPATQQYRVAKYLMQKKFSREKRFPRVLTLAFLSSEILRAWVVARSIVRRKLRKSASPSRKRFEQSTNAGPPMV